jgi:co-chaperonin GroES (HSP10)
MPAAEELPSALNIEPIGERVLCKVLQTALKSPGGIYLPEQQNTTEALVLKVGADNKQNLAPGMRVLFEQHEGIPLSYNKEQYVLFSPQSLIAVLENESESEQLA